MRHEALHLVPTRPQDHGLALEPWTRVRFQNAAIFAGGDVAFSQGNVWDTDADGQDVMVEKSFDHMRRPDGKLRIMRHHSPPLKRRERRA